MHAPRQKTWQEKLVRSGYFFGAVLLHLIVFLLVATVIIWKEAKPPEDASFKGVKVSITQPPPPQPSSSGAAAANPEMEPEQVTVPVPVPRQTITSFNDQFKIDTPKVTEQSLPQVSMETPQGSGLAAGAGDTGTGSSGFGSDSGAGNGLSGYFYDLKQTTDRKPTGVGFVKFYPILTAFVSNGWNDAMFDRYFKSKTALNANSFAIPMRPSVQAPKAFKVENEVQPAYWIAHYHGKVVAPETGDYQFLGFADNVIVVRIGNEIVLDAGWTILLPERKELHRTLPFPWLGNKMLKVQANMAQTEPDFRRNRLKIGPKFHMEAGNPVEMDVLIGDDGGSCGFYLLVMNSAHTYEKLPDGTPKAPFFQLGGQGPPSVAAGDKYPPYSTTPEPWQGAGN